MKRNQYPNEIMKRSSSSNSETMTHYESPHSPLRLHTHFRSDQGDSDNNTSNYASPEASPVPQHPVVDNSMALIAIDKSTQFNANSSPTTLPSPPLPPSTPAQQSLQLTMNRAVREEGQGVTTKTKILAYLLISASSAAATRVDDWQSNWGKDEFTEMASASIAMAFLAFIAFAFSSIISGFKLWTHQTP
ncbi:hypothetical protein Gotri_009041 [Gossypium trilobum]|uniref:CASP-like protein n=1 Tax=Gossypium trilobum TaxID=34281 RepID=A0A7J9ELS9_9ROSI|nr:hypothetical protein [Gossypium trilobum]